MMTILVTGASGFIGKALSASLCRASGFVRRNCRFPMNTPF
jgi:nucleoside-diphosphate-sugar epimerase